MKLTDEQFAMVIEATPLVSIDLIVRDSQSRILMGKRINRPAMGSWFVPGGRIKKGETFAAALSRIAEEELDVELTERQVRFVGVFDHIYEDNFAGIKGISTQYIVLAYECQLELSCDKLPLTQHSCWRWLGDWQLDEVHKNSAAYFKAVKTLDAL